MHVQDDLNLHILHMLEGTFSLDVAQMTLVKAFPTFVFDRTGAKLPSIWYE